MALTLAPVEASQAVTVVPIFSPSTIAAEFWKTPRGLVLTSPSQPFRAQVMVMAIAADEDCTRRVRKMPVIRNSITEPKPWSLSIEMVLSIIRAAAGSVASMVRRSGTESFRSPRPRKTRPKPIKASPQLRPLSFPAKKKGSPIPTIGSASLATSNFPIRATIHAVVVVPRFAPMITPMAWISVSRPAFTKETTRTVDADDDWTRVVVKKPVRIPLKRVLVMPARAVRMRSPAIFCTPSDITFIP